MCMALCMTAFTTETTATSVFNKSKEANYEKTYGWFAFGYCIL